MKTFLCPNCGAENLMTYRFCGNCGTRLAAGTQLSAKVCPRCAEENLPHYKFCGRCGMKLDTLCPNCGAAVPPDSRYCPSCAYLCGEGRYKVD